MGSFQVRKVKGKMWKPLYYVMVTGKKAGVILRGCYEFLLLKKEQADIAFAFLSLQRIGGDKKPIPAEEWAKRESLKEQLTQLKEVIQ